MRGEVCEGLLREHLESSSWSWPVSESESGSGAECFLDGLRSPRKLISSSSEESLAGPRPNAAGRGGDGTCSTPGILETGALGTVLTRGAGADLVLVS